MFVSEWNFTYPISVTIFVSDFMLAYVLNMAGHREHLFTLNKLFYSMCRNNYIKESDQMSFRNF